MLLNVHLRGCEHSHGCGVRGCEYSHGCGVQVSVPQHRLTPLKTAWLSLYQPITDNLKLDMRMNLKTRKVAHAAPGSTGPATQSSSLKDPRERPEAGCLA